MGDTIHILKLTPSTLTRPRGEEAGRKVAACVQAGAVELDFSETSPSLSFLDGLILALQETHTLQLVSFTATDPAVHDRLVRIANERCVVIPIHLGEVRPKPSSTPSQGVQVDEHIEQAHAQSKFAQV
jgi:hypothetical protein